MTKHWICPLLLMVTTIASAAEKRFDFSLMPEGPLTNGFRSAVTGEGRPGQWKIIAEDAPTAFEPLSSRAPNVSQRRVLAQLSRDKADEHFPILLHTNDSYSDFTFTTRFKLVDGENEQMAGIAFRVQDENNYYVLRASALGNTLRFYKFVNGQRSQPVGVDVSIPKGVWHEMSVRCKGTEIHCLLNGKEAIPMLSDNSFRKGMVGFWTKSDSVSAFSDAVVTYVPAEPRITGIVRAALKNYPRLVGLYVYANVGTPANARMVAGSDPALIGQVAGDDEKDVLAKGTIYQGKDPEKDTAAMLMPLRDRNGEVIAAVKVRIQSFPGQTDQNILVRAKPVVQYIQSQLGDTKDLFE